MAKRESRQIACSEDGRRAIYIDTQNEAEILEYINRDKKHAKKFNYISNLILKNIRMSDVYDKEDINNRCKDVTAMKFFKGGSNDRIYCKEIRNEHGVFIVIAAILLEKKKSQKNTNREKTLIEQVGTYEY